MSRIVVIGGTGFAGSRIVAEAASRGHDVVSVSRTMPATGVTGVRSVVGSILDPAVRRDALDGADVIVGAISPMGDMAGRMREAYASIAEDADSAGARLIVIGSYNALRPAAGAPRFVETADVADEYRALVEETVAIADDLAAGPEQLRWVYVSPPAFFGIWANVTDTGRAVAGGEIAGPDHESSSISPADLALGVLDEIENPTRDRGILSLFV